MNDTAQTYRRISAAEKIADLLGADVSEVIAGKYCPFKYHSPAIYVVGDDYYAASESKPKYQVGQPWTLRKTWRGDSVWESLCS